MGKDILVLLGSDSDKQKVLPKVEEVFKETDFNYTCSLASSHRTPELVAERIHEKGYDGIITAGGLSLILTADTIREVERGRRNEKSPYYGRWTPVISVPLSDTVSGGLTALLSIQETPSGYPASVVGIDRADTAARCMKNILGNEYKRTSLAVDYKPSLDLVQNIKEALRKLNIEYDHKEDFSQSDNFYMYCYSYNTSLESMESAGSFYIAVKSKRQTNLKRYEQTISKLNNALNVSIGNPDNAAILAAQILSLKNPSLLDAIDLYREAGRRKYYEV